MQEISIGMIGYKFMGRAHTAGYKKAPMYFQTIDPPKLKVICGRDEKAVKRAAENNGWEEYETNWERVIKRDDINLIDICAPNYLHKEIALAAADSDKNIFCEKPLANNLSDAKTILDAVEKRGVKHMMAFCNRRIPAVGLAKQLIEEGKLGKIYQWRGFWLSGWAANPEVPLSWRFKREKIGSGAVGDLGAHVIDLARFLVGDIDSVVGMTKTFVKERPLPDNPNEMGEVDVDDAGLFLAKFKNGATGSFELSRSATGNGNHYAFEVNGSKGSVKFDYNRINLLEYFSVDDDPRTNGFRTILVGSKDHPYGDKWGRPGGGAGHPDGYSDVFSYQAYELLNALQNDLMPNPDFNDGVKCQAVVEAVEKSAEEGKWKRVDDLL